MNLIDWAYGDNGETRLDNEHADLVKDVIREMREEYGIAPTAKVLATISGMWLEKLKNTKWRITQINCQEHSRIVFSLLVGRNIGHSVSE